MGRSTAFADLSSWRTVEVTGAEALSWLDALVSADLRGLRSGEGRRTLLLSPTGQIRAEFTVGQPGAGRVVLAQDPAQPRPVGDLLGPYVLSADVALTDRTGDLALFALPGSTEPPEWSGEPWWSPSVLGPGVDLVVPRERRAAVAEGLRAAREEVTNEELERWRIEAGAVRVGVDVAPEDLPQEAGLDHLVNQDKGCFLGQEAVARVRNLGHPRRVVLRLEAPETLSAGETVLSGDREVGTVTSAVRTDGVTVALARVGWLFRDDPLTSPRGVPLRVRSAQDG